MTNAKRSVTAGCFTYYTETAENRLYIALSLFSEIRAIIASVSWNERGDEMLFGRRKSGILAHMQRHSTSALLFLGQILRFWRKYGGTWWENSF
ncbi:MAG TPA: hypothetical protein DIW34_03035 [Oribacterium sp.]|nr:hypothetical protein [Oribacterium sp.]